MDYSELNITLKNKNKEIQELLIAELFSIEFEGFDEQDDSISAFYQSSIITDKENIKLILDKYKGQIKEYSIHTVEKINWNKIWEENFNPVFFDEQCVIKASFHESFPKIKYQITIDPKMSFGTGHHETTSLMITTILQNDLREKKIADIGCGTCVLSILASLKGAKSITAIDIDEWAYNNALENCHTNNIRNINIFKGDIEILLNEKFEIIMANINKNVLLKHLQNYSKLLLENGELFLSGIYNSDKEIILKTAINEGFEYINCIEKNNWIALTFKKKADI